MEKCIVFENLKFKSSFNFQNNKEKTEYFNDLLFKSTYLFQERQKQYFSEKMHILFSYSHLYKWVGILAGVVSLPTIHTIFAPVFILFMILFGLLWVIYKQRFKNAYFGYSFISSINEDEEYLSILKNEIKMGGKIQYN